MQPRFWPLIIAVVVFQLLFPPFVFAQNNPHLAVPPLYGGTYESARKAVIKALKESEEVSVVDPDQLDRYLKSRSSKKKKTSSKEGSRLLEKGKKAYRELKLKQAKEYLRKAKLKYRNNLSDEVSFSGLRAAQVHLAMVYLGDNDSSSAKEELRDVVIIDPERSRRKLSEKLYSPKLRQMYEEVRDELMKEGAAELQVITQPKGADVQVDGKMYDVSPITISALPPGEHFIQAFQRGSEVHFSTKFLVKGSNRLDIKIEGGKAVNIAGYFLPVRDPQEIDPNRASFLDEVGLAVKADILEKYSVQVCPKEQHECCTSQ